MFVIPESKEQKVIWWDKSCLSWARGQAEILNTLSLLSHFNYKLQCPRISLDMCICPVKNSQSWEMSDQKKCLLYCPVKHKNMSRYVQLHIYPKSIHGHWNCCSLHWKSIFAAKCCGWEYCWESLIIFLVQVTLTDMWVCLLFRILRTFKKNQHKSINTRLHHYC